MIARTANHQWVQFGCGLCAPEDWLNFDSSPMMRLQRLPLVGALVPSGLFGRYPANVRYGDITQGLPIPDHSVELLYCSHILEHLTLGELRQALKNCYRHLKPGGTFRLVVPDLEVMAKAYLTSDEPKAAHEFMRVTWLGKEERDRGLVAFLKDWLSGNTHLWMYDYDSLAYELEAVGFQHLRRARYGDSSQPAFSQLEDPERWTLELGIECIK
jgi:ubiquinone/menaquinone biosynthesis C-methylase UbiE